MRLQVPLPESTKFLVGEWTLEKTWDEANAFLTDGIQIVNLKSYFPKRSMNKAIFDYHNHIVALKAKNKLPKCPDGAEEYAMEHFCEARPMGSYEAGGYRNPLVKRSCSAKAKAKGSADGGASDMGECRTPNPAKRRRVIAPKE